MRIRKTINGSAAAPRLSVFRSNKEIYAQLIDDTTGKTIVAASSRDKKIENKDNIVAICKSSKSPRALLDIEETQYRF